MHIGFWWETQKAADHWEDQDVRDDTVIPILEKENNLLWSALI
jgi:hypothetical protein